MMKYILYTFLIFAVACTTVDPPEPEIVDSLCQEDEFQFSINVDGITLTTEDCWLVYHEDPTSSGLVGDFPAVLKWEYPGFPEWNSANSLTFIYNETSLESGEDYQAREVLGVVKFDGADGEMFQGLGEESMTISVTEYNAESGYICGSFEGKALFTDYQVVYVQGDFKAVLDPQ